MQRDRLRILVDQISDENVARVLTFAELLAIDAEKQARARRCWSCGKPRDYTTHPRCSSCFAPHRRCLRTL